MATDSRDDALERADLFETLDAHRGFLRYTVRELTDEQARKPATASLLALRARNSSPVHGMSLDEVVREVGSGVNAKRPLLARLLSDSDVARIIVEHRDALARFGVEHLEAALSAQGRSILVVDESEVDDDLVKDMTEVLTSFCARLYGRRGARNRALRAMTTAKNTALVT